MRNPNGYGSVVKLSGNRRNPYAVRKTKGFNAKRQPIYAVIGYYPTWEEAAIALADYNNDPWDIDRAKLTFEALYDLWAGKKAPKLGRSNRYSLQAAYKHCADIHALRYRDIRAHHMQECVDNCRRGYATQKAIRNLFDHLDRFALELDLISRRYSELVTVAPAPESCKRPFTDEEVARLWTVAEEPWIDSVLLFMYSGWRISELLDLKCADVDLSMGTMTGGMKTKAGKDRIVPIHSRVAYLAHRRALEGGEYLFTLDGKRVSLNRYYAIWQGIMAALGMNHTPHECRHTFRSRLDSAGANKVCIDLIMGHKSKDVGERIYTHKTLQELKNAIELITN
jgi:integrase